MLNAAKVVSIIPPKEKPKRAELSVLDSYISHISLWSSQSAQNESIGFEKIEVAVNPWVAKVIHRYCNSDVAPGDVEDLVTQSVAVIAKCRTDMACEVTDTKNLTDVYTRQAELMLDVAVGTVVLRELQNKGNELLAKGSNDDVRELNQLQHETRNVVQEVRNSLNEGEKERASQLASTFMPEIEKGVDVSCDEPEPIKQPEPANQPKPRKHPAPPAAKKTEKSAPKGPVVIHVAEPDTKPGKFRSFAFGVIAVGALVAAATYGISQHRTKPVQGDVSESLMMEMSNMSGVTNVQDRNPYVVLTVHADFWNTTSDSRRTDWIKDLSRLAERHGYTGLLVRSSGGAPLAEWLSGRGVQFASESPESS